MISQHTMADAGCRLRDATQLTYSFLDNPSLLGSPLAAESISNLMQLVEMARSESYADMIGPCSFKQDWHSQIEPALWKSLSTAFPQMSGEDALSEFEAIMIEMASDSRLTGDQEAALRDFLKEFEKSLS
jgi:hypothetical protein